jgi:hypothetical protein
MGQRVYLKRDVSELVRVCATATPDVFDLEAAVRSSIASGA